MNTYTCPKCQAPFASGTKFCQSCGANLEKEFIENPVCPKCNKTFIAGTKFCDVDGSKLVSTGKLIPKCIRCGTEYADGTKFCPKDGGAVIAEAFRYTYSNPSPGQITDFGYRVPYNKASLGDRFLASLLDSLIVLGLCIPSVIFISLALSKYNRYYSTDGKVITFALVAILLFLIPLGYSFIKDGIGKGQSYGKKAMGLMVVSLDDNLPCTKTQSFVRCLIGLLLGIIPYVGGLIEPIIVLAASDGRKLGDKAANTQVIHVTEYNQPNLY